MAVLYITEYAGNSYLPNGIPVANEPAVNNQTVAIGASSVASSAFKSNTSLIRLHTDAICSVVFGTSPTATATNRRMSANQTEYFTVPEGMSYEVAVITNT